MPLEHLSIRWMAEQPNSWRGLLVDAPLVSGLGSMVGHGGSYRSRSTIAPAAKYERLGRVADPQRPSTVTLPAVSDKAGRPDR
jgi:hypothetical protein